MSKILSRITFKTMLINTGGDAAILEIHDQTQRDKIEQLEAFVASLRDSAIAARDNGDVDELIDHVLS